MILPDYDNSTLSVVSSILRVYGGESLYPPLMPLNAQLAQAPRNVVLLLLDGMGYETVCRHLSQDSWIRRHMLTHVTSVFPSTTAASTTAFYAACSPNEHGWLGWSLYFKECARQLDVFTGADSYTKEKFSAVSPAYAIMPFRTLFEQLHDLNGERISTVSVFPFDTEFDRGAAIRKRLPGHDITALFRALTGAVRHADRPVFAMGYHTQPDHQEHIAGPDDPDTIKLFKKIDSELAAFARSLFGTDTALIVTADHGLIGPVEPIFLNTVPEIMRCLIMPPSMEGRAASFFVKPEKRQAFEESFNRLYSDDFVLYTREQVLAMELFGRGIRHEKVEDFVGDYLACAIGKKYFDYAVPGQEMRRKYIGAHAGLTSAEMLVPVLFARL